jgi:predicted amidohydrolase
MMTGSFCDTPAVAAQEYKYPELPEKLTIGVCQIHLLRGDGPNGDVNIDRNIREMSRLIDEAVARGAGIVVVPEYWAFGYVDKETLHKIAEPVPGGKLTSFMRNKAKEHRVHLVGGTVIEKGEGGRIHNTNIFIGPDGDILSTHRKAHLYTPLGEHLVFSAGDKFGITKTPWGNAGIMICYDGDFPEVPRLLKLMGAHILFELAAYETPCESWWTDLYKAHAMTNAVWLVQACDVGKCMDDKVHLFGKSRILSPNGKVVAEATYYPPDTPVEKMESEVLLVTIDYQKGLEKGRKKLQCLTNDRRPDLYGPLTVSP